MGALLKYFIYIAIFVLLAIGCITLFKSHPEVQFAFLLPGLFIVLYAIIRDAITRGTNTVQSMRAEIKASLKEK